MTTTKFTPGSLVQTPLGKGVVREVRGNGRLLVAVKGRAVLFDAPAVTLLAVSSPTKRRTPPPDAESIGQDRHDATREIDLHGLTVEEALARCDEALNEALLADVAELRMIHGKGGRRIRDALHRRLREISAVRAFRVDPRNTGVTIVRL